MENIKTFGQHINEQKKLSVNTQTRPSTKWNGKDCDNANIYVGNVQIGVMGEQDMDEPIVQIRVDGKEFNIPLSQFSSSIASVFSDYQQ